MTASELKEKAKRMDKYHTHYDFIPDEMQAFIDQICLEQRENCLKAGSTNDKDAIMNAKKPDGI